MREDQWAISVRVGDLDLGIFDKKTGGEIDSEEGKYRPGAMAGQVSLGGSVAVSNLTVSRLYELERDHNRFPQLRALVGKGDMTAVVQPLDVDGNVYGKPVVYTGKLKQLSLPDVDSESSDPALFELEMSSASTVG